MTKTIMIYATKHGSVENAVAILKEKMPGEILLVNIMGEVPPSLADYENVIIGGSIYVGKIQKKLEKYVENHLDELLKKKVGLFICAAQEEKVREKELEDAFPRELYQHACCKEVFGYEIHYEDMNFIEKKIVSKILGHKESYSELSGEKMDHFARVMADNEYQQL
jgi:menaquinone-dependent protoporphyrinogen oxidase